MEQKTDDLTELSDGDLRDRAVTAIHAAAVMNGTHGADRYHDAVDAIYDECARRGRGIYHRAYNEVARSQGYDEWTREPATGSA